MGLHRLIAPLYLHQRRARSAKLTLLLWVAATWAGVQAPGLAQIVPDTTLSTPSIVTPAANTSTITGGTAVGNHLFHSFERFSIRSGETAWFNQPLTVQNIFTRVTGSTISQIDGQLRANGSANLFLLNPNGIIFGANAQLNIGGSFIGSTAQSLQFADGTEFSAIAPSRSALLTLSVPMGLQYGANPAPITVQGPGHNLTVNTSNFAVNRAARPAGLRVQPGQTLALVGGNVNLAGGNLTAENGRVELAAVGSAGLVPLTATNPGWTIGPGWTVGNATVENATVENATVGNAGPNRSGEVRLTQAASIDTSGSSGGAIRVQGRQVSLTDGSTFLATTLGNGQGQGITVQAAESLEVLGFSGTATAPKFPSSLLTDATVGSTATAQGGSIFITTGALRVRDGGQISASTLAAGNAGNLMVKAPTITLQGGSARFGSSGLFSNVVNRTARGSGGILQVEAQQLTISDGARISVSTTGIGNAGQLNVQAPSIDLVGRTSFGSSGLVARGAAGNGGNLTVQTDRLRVADGAQIAVSTSGIGKAGRLTVMAQDIELVGIESSAPSGLFASVQPRASGKGGDLMITATRLRVRDGAQVAVSTGGTGNAGDLIVKAQAIELSGSSPQSLSGLFASAVIDTGEGGDLSVSTQKLTIQDGATISVSNFSSNTANAPGRGPAGNMFINADAISLSNGGTITASTLAGASGNIDIKSATMVMQQQSLITTNSKGNDPGGNIKINTNFLIGTQNSDITANAVNAKGGQVAITAQRIWGLVGRDRLTPESDITATSELGVAFGGTVQINTLALDPANGIVTLPVDIVDPSQQIATGCATQQTASFVVTGRGGVEENPSGHLKTTFIWPDLRPRQLARPLNPVMETAIVVPPLVEATAWRLNPQNQPELIASQGESVPARSNSVTCRK
jgi:filamentous hemagglutinin family protein